jgi:2-polyprenyl-3-methyl-5-hydroxy-6-metoxy-1,4-benzoquinol methylase
MKRFEFGKNWKSFLEVLNESRIRAAEESLIRLLGANSLEGRTFLDIGCGSGLFSLAARRLGASVVSFDADAHAAACAAELKKEFFDGDQRWTIQHGSVLEEQFLSGLGQFDIVYSWGVLHHSGAMWQAITNALSTVAPGGKLVLALYNDQGWKSRGWHLVKRLYCSNTASRIAILAVFVPSFAVVEFCVDLARLRNPARRYLDYKRERGMSKTHDWRDWLGGLPFEVAKPTAVIRFCEDRGFQLERLIDCGNKLGNNEFVFSRS